MQAMSSSPRHCQAPCRMARTIQGSASKLRSAVSAHHRAHLWHRIHVIWTHGDTLSLVQCRCVHTACMLSSCPAQHSQLPGGELLCNAADHACIAVVKSDGEHGKPVTASARLSVPAHAAAQLSCCCPCSRNQRSWLYRIRPSVTHEPFHPLDFPAETLTADFRQGVVTPNQLVSDLEGLCALGLRAAASTAIHMPDVSKRVHALEQNSMCCQMLI